MTDKGSFSPFKLVWFSATAVLFAIAIYMMYTNQSSSGFHGAGSRFGNSAKQTITGYSVLRIAELFLIIGVALFWPFKKKKKDAV